ncbi:ABC transporter substrate-binding protein [Oxalicibacterium faecigallinarum]|uniref:ABC transporter substrate-binding protein n=1 Tax=Oxalicibacterium faecigallinarum TaxID=573741 RepID=A0A8J3AQV9_9BURK|nr:NrtA/SsuA/CpmA family ABC transporter substrate-binding protein [Oxalicibacterium faecigallinarum]GGI20096.1 ABC transporter substrate-binding protein [Oxalicibacterium faecigallinarum]
MSNRRTFIASLIAASFAVGGMSSAFAADQVIKVGTLKLMHGITPYFYDKFTPPGYKIEVIPFETPTDGKNAVVTKSVDFGTYGLAAATLGAAAGEPVVVIAAQCNRGMAVVARTDSGIDSIKGLKGKRVGILPGSTQEVVILDRLKQEGMTVKDITPVRVSFSEMASALERGDVDAYVGAEPGPSISVGKGIGKIVEYPYTTPTGTVNMVMTAHADTIKAKPELIKVFLKIHQQATDYVMANRAAFVDMSVQKLGLPAKTAELAAPNVELTWKLDDDWSKRAQYYGSQMLDKKQIRRLPDYSTFIDASFVKQVK